MKFSVIVPIYNIEPYLPECIESVLAQTFPDFELILVDDGSPDNCPAICDRYAEKDPRIRVIHKENGGLVSARQAGAEIASGTYIYCLDGDDYVKPTLLEEAAKLCEEKDADIIGFGARYFNSQTAWDVVDPVPEGWYDRGAIRQTIFPKLLMDAQMTFMLHFLWGKIFRRSLYLPYQMAVDRRISLGEDVACLMPIYMQAQCVYISHKCLYCFRQREASISRSFSMKQFDQLVIGIEDLRKYENDPVPDFQAQVDRYALLAVLVQLVSAIARNGGDQLDAICRYVHHPVLWQGVQNAVYSGVSAKSRIAYKLLRLGQIKAAYYFLLLCEQLKRSVKNEP